MLKTGEKLQKLITLLITWTVLIVLIFGYERYFVSSQQAFLKEEEFHSLERLSEELKAQVKRAQASTVSLVQLADGPDPMPYEKLTAFQQLYLKEAWSGANDVEEQTRSITAAKKCPAGKGSPVPLESELKGLALDLYCVTGNTKEPSGHAPGGQIYTLNLEPWIKTAFHPLSGDFDDVLIADETGDVLFQNSSDGPRISDLKPLVLSGGGTTEPSTPESADTDTSEEPARPSADKHHGTADDKAASSRNPNLSLADVKRLHKLTDTSFFTHTTLAGEGYELFSVPVRLRKVCVNPDKSCGGSLVVSGLRRTSSFDADSHAIPYSTLIWATLIAVAIFSLSWPLAKLRYMSNTERFTPKEGLFLIVTIFLAAASVTLMILNASYTSRVRAEEDQNLKTLANRIKQHFGMEMKLAYEQMQQLDPDKVNGHLVTNYLATPEREKGGQWPSTYPFFEVAFWADKDGQQVRKLDIRPAITPLVNVRGQDFFQRSIEDLNWTPNSAEQHYYVGPEISITTAVFAPVLGAPYKPSTDSIAVQVLAIRPMSLMEPVLPPGYGFAVIDAECNVLFHSEVFRDKRENFCQESKRTAELKPWLFGGNESAVDISYAGRPERALIMSMTFPNSEGPQFAGGPAYLVVFRTSGYDLTLNMAVMLVCCLLFGSYAVLLLLAVIGVRVFLPGLTRMIDVPRLLWPRVENRSRYVEASIAIGIILFFYWRFYAHVYEAVLLTLSLLVAFLSALFTVLKLGCAPRVLFRVGHTMAVISLLFLALVFILRKQLPESWHDWWSVIVLLGIAGFVALLLSGFRRWTLALAARATKASAWMRNCENILSALVPKTSAQVKHFLNPNVASVYAVLAVVVITGVCIVPCIGCFKFAYDAVCEVALKHEQIELSNALLARRERIRQYYDQLVSRPASGEQGGAKQALEKHTIQQVAEKRIEQVSDRYDWAFNVCYTGGHGNELDLGPDRDPNDPHQCWPSPQQDTQPPCADGSRFAEGLNVAIEKAITHMVLVYPSNQLGSEMSKLGVASSESSCAAEHYFKEADDNRFKLTWKSGSRLAGFTVESEYLTWQGLSWWGTALLLLLWLALGLWLTKVVRQIFLTDVQKPRIPAVSWESASEIKSNFLVLSLAESGKSEWLHSIKGLSADDTLDLRVELGKIKPGSPYPNPSNEGAVVILDHFDFNLKDRDDNKTRLNLLEHLLYETNCRVLLVSSVDPLYFLTEGAPDVLSAPEDPELSRGLLERWARALSKFEKVRPATSTEREFGEQIRDFIRKHENRRKFALAVRQECHCTAKLRRIGISLLEYSRESDPDTREWVANCVLDWAAEYYRVIWAELTANERLALYQLALDGWANSKNRAALQQLEGKGLIRRMPMYRIMNESFRQFVPSPEHAKEIEQWETQQKQSTWRAVRMVLLGLAVIAGGWLFRTQAALSQELVAYVAGIAALLTAASALFGRSGKQATVKSESS